MKKNLYSFFAIVSSILSFHLGANDTFQSKLELGQGYRHDKLKFTISGRHHKPNILSELDYKNQQIYLTTLKGTLSNGTYIGVVDLAYGDILHGKVRDSDYSRNNKHGEFSRSILKIHGDYTVDASAKIGRIFPLFSGISLTPSIGYGAFWQHLHVKQGRQVIPVHAHISHLNSSYKTVWSAPFVDLLCTAPLAKTVFLDLEYMFFYPIKYTGKGHWNLRHLHFKQTNKEERSYGQKGDIHLRWACTNRLELGLGFGLAHFTAKDGTVKFNQHGFHSHQPSRRAVRTFTDYLVTLSYAF